MVDNYNEPRLVAYLCCLPDLSWWACSSMPGGLALVFDSNPISSHVCKEPGPGNQPHFLCLWDCVTVRNSFLLRESQGPHLRVCVPEDNQMRRHKHLHLKIRIFWEKKVPLLNSAWETIWTRIFINQINYFPQWKQTRHSVRLSRYLSKAILITTFSFFLTVSSEVPCLTFENHMFLSGWGC